MNVCYVSSLWINYESWNKAALKRPILNIISTSTDKNQTDRRKLCSYQESKFQHSYYEKGKDTEGMPWVAVPQKSFIILAFDSICLSLNIGNTEYLQKCLIFEILVFSSISLVVILIKNQMLGIIKIKQHILVKNMAPELHIMIYISWSMNRPIFLKTLYLHYLSFHLVYQTWL